MPLINLPSIVQKVLIDTKSVKAAEAATTRYATKFVKQHREMTKALTAQRQAQEKLDAQQEKSTESFDGYAKALEDTRKKLAGMTRQTTATTKAVREGKMSHQEYAKAVKAAEEQVARTTRTQERSTRTTKKNNDTIKRSAKGFADFGDDSNTAGRALGFFQSQAKKAGDMGGYLGKAVQALKFPALAFAISGAAQSLAVLTAGAGALVAQFGPAFQGILAGTLAFAGQLAPAVGSVAALPAVIAAFASSKAVFTGLTKDATEAASKLKDLKKGSEEYNEVLKELPKPARAFAVQLADIAHEFDHVREEAQKVALPMFANALKDMRPVIDIVKKSFVDLAEVIGGLAEDFADRVSRPKFLEDLAFLAEQNTRLVGILGDAIGPLATSFVNMAVAATPMTEMFAQAANNLAHLTARWTDSQQGMATMSGFFKEAGETMMSLIGTVSNLSQVIWELISIGADAWGTNMVTSLESITGSWLRWIEAAENTGRITEWFQRTREALGQLGSTIGDFSVGLYNVFKLGAESIGIDFVGGLEEAAKKFRDFTESSEGIKQIRDYFKDTGPILRELGGIAKDAAAIFMGLGDNQDLVLFLQMIRENVLPAFRDLMEGVSGQMGPAIARLIELFIKFTDALSFSPLIVTVEGFAKLANVLLDLMEKVPGLSSFIATLIVMKTSLVGLSLASHVTGFGKLASSIAAVGPAGAAGAKGFSGFIQGVRGATVATAASTGSTVTASNAIGSWVRSMGRAIATSKVFQAVAKGMRVAWAAMLGPIGLVIAIIAAVVGGLVLLYKKNEDFRNFVNEAWASIKDFIADAWENWIKPVFQAIGDWITDTLIPAMISFWKNGVLPAWEGIKAAISFAWESIIKPVFEALMNFITKVIIPGMQWLYDKVIKPVWNLISYAFQVAWAIIVIIFKAWQWYVSKVVGPIILWLYNKVVKPAWEGMKATFKAGWAVVEAIFRGIKWVIEKVVAPVFRWLYNNIIKPLWDGVGATIKWTWNNVIKPVFDTLTNFISDTVAPGFRRGIDAIKTAWDKLKNVAKAPVKFVVNTVWNDGLRKAINTISDKLGAGITIAPFKLPRGFASGGQVDGHSPHKRADNIPAALTAGEYVHPVDAVKYYGVQFMEAIRKRQLPKSFAHLANGGPVGTGTPRKDGRTGFYSGGLVTLGRLLQQMGVKVTEHPAFGRVGTHSPGSAHYTGDAIDLNTRPGTSAQEQAELTRLIPLIKQHGFRIIWMTKDHYNHMHVDSRGGPDIGNFAGAGAGGGGGIIPDWLKDPMKWLKDRVPDIFKNFPRNDFTNILGSIPKKLLDWGWDKIKGFFGGVGDWLFDSGGIASGSGLIHKKTLRPERVLSPQQTELFERLIGALEDVARAPQTPFDLSGVTGGRAVGVQAVRSPSGGVNGLDGLGTVVQIDQKVYAPQNMDPDQVGTMVARRTAYALSGNAVPIPSTAGGRR